MCLDINHSSLWMQHDLEVMVSNAIEEAIDLPESIKDEVLNSISVLLVTIDTNEILSTQCYLRELYGHTNIYKFLKHIDIGGQKSKCITFYIGKYGLCPAAIGIVPNDHEIQESTSNFTVMVYECFPYLTTIVSVGIVGGIQRKVKICDILVSSKVVYNDKKDADHGKTETKTIDISNKLIDIFNQPNGWPKKSIQERLKYNDISKPKVISGVILSGSHDDDPTMTSEDIAPDVIGIEIKGTHLIKGALQNMVDIIIVKAVCSLDTEEYSETFQPTASLLAANLVYECLSSSQVQKSFEGLLIILSHYIAT